MKKLLTCLILLIFIAGCKEKFIANVQSPPGGYLVVEGFINSGQDPTEITLTRSTRLYDTADIVYEHNAVVNIESENNELFPLYENGNGVYSSSSLTLDNNQKYRLKITTQDNKQYVSDFTSVKRTPAIDSISWQRENDGVRIYINTHDPQNTTRYYQWKYEETWEIHSAYLSTLLYVRDPVSGNILGVGYRFPSGAPDTTIYKCWPTNISTNILIGSSEKLSDDKIYLPLLFINQGSRKLSVLYSLKIKQYALSRQAYQFYERVKKNTEQLGSVFDPQPSESQGNIHCVTNPAETVIGYVDISEEKEQRLFISNAEVPGWNYKTGCALLIMDNNPDSIAAYGSGLTPVAPVKIMGIGTIVTFSATTESCVNCTLIGTNSRPPFWP